MNSYPNITNLLFDEVNNTKLLITNKKDGSLVAKILRDGKIIVGVCADCDVGIIMMVLDSEAKKFNEGKIEP